MPPVFGPVSPSPTRLKSWAGASGSTRVPSLIPNRDTSGPSRYSSMTTRPQRAACATASARSVVTTTPLPAASPSSLTTYGGPNSASAPATSASVSATTARAVGTPAAVMTSFANALEPSSLAAAAVGPKQAIPAARTASATPPTSGASGPITIRSAPRCRASSVTPTASVAGTGCVPAIRAMPALPGAQARAVTAGSAAKAWQGTCSRPPEPMTRMFTGGEASAGAGRRGYSGLTGLAESGPLLDEAHARPVTARSGGVLRLGDAGPHLVQADPELRIEAAPAGLLLDHLRHREQGGDEPLRLTVTVRRGQACLGRQQRQCDPGALVRELPELSGEIQLDRAVEQRPASVDQAVPGLGQVATDLPVLTERVLGRGQRLLPVLARAAWHEPEVIAHV